MAPVTPLPIDERLRVRRPELKLVAMSATLDAEPVAAFLGGAPVVRSEGRTFPLTIEHAAAPDDRQLGKQVSAAVRTLAQQGLDGDVLVFLPGTGENRRCAEDLEDAARTFDLAVVPLHGDLPSDEQDAAVRPGPRRKVILATNGAETSVTIEGVTCVVDSGLARIARHSPWSGVPSLEIEPVSKASCTQRAGRAGRTRPGRVLRRYTKHDFDTRRPFELPEIARADLAGVALELHGAGVHDLRWYETPPAAAWEAGESLLVRLGAVKAGAITALGRRMLQFPVHPRQARIVVEAEGRGVAREACSLAALLGARELRLERRGRGEAKLSSPSDLIDDLDALLDARSHGLRADRLRRDGLDSGSAHAVDRAAKQLERIADTRARAPASDLEVDRELQIATLTGFPDRVGKRRAPKSAEIVFAGGGSGSLAASSSVNEPELVVADDVGEVGARGSRSSPSSCPASRRRPTSISPRCSPPPAKARRRSPSCARWACSHCSTRASATSARSSTASHRHTCSSGAAARRFTTSSPSRRGSHRACRTSSAARARRRSATAASRWLFICSRPTSARCKSRPTSPASGSSTIPRCASSGCAAIPSTRGPRTRCS